VSKTREDLRDTVTDIGRAVTVARRLARRVAFGELPRMAAALSFRTIFGLIPVLVIGVALLGSFATPDQVRDAIEKLLDFSGLGEIAVAPSETTTLQQMAGGGVSVRTPFGPVWFPDPNAAPAPEVNAQQAERLDEWITALVDRVSGSSFGALGIAGVGVLIFAAFVMMLEIERAFNQICAAGSGRRWSKRIPVYWAVLTLGPISLIASFYVGERFMDVVASLGGPAFIGAFFGYFVTVGISTLLLMLAYTAVPNARVHLRPALAGAFVAAVLWEAGKWGFTLYSKNTSYVSFYGSVALLMVFLVWVNITWLIVLFGLQIAHAMQHFDSFKKAGPQDREKTPAEQIPVDPLRYVQLATEAARRFEKGKTIDPDDAAEACGLSAKLTEHMLGRLAKAGILRAVAGEDGYLLAMPPAKIDLSLLMEMGDAPNGPGSTGIRKLIAARLSAAEGMTLGDLDGAEAAQDSAIGADSRPT